MILGSSQPSLVLNRSPPSEACLCRDLTIFVHFAYSFHLFQPFTKGISYVCQTDLICVKFNDKIYLKLFSSCLLPWKRVKVARTVSLYQ